MTPKLWACGSPPRLGSSGTHAGAMACPCTHTAQRPTAAGGGSPGAGQSREGLAPLLAGQVGTRAVGQMGGYERRRGGDHGPPGAHPFPPAPSFTNCCPLPPAAAAPGPRVGAGAPHRGSRECSCSPGLGSPSFTFCLFLLPVCSSPPALLHPSCTRCTAHRREELGVLPASL